MKPNCIAAEANSAAGNMCNIGCGERVSLNTLIRLLEEIIGVKAEVIYEEPKPGDVRHSLADIAQARHVLGYEPKIMLNEGLRRTVEAFR